MDRRLEAGREEIRHQRQRQRDEALHVDRAAAIGPAVRDMQRERIARPGLTLHRHDVGMAGEDDAALVLRADRGEQRRLVAARIGKAHRGHAPAREVILDEGDQLEIGFVAHRVEGNEAGEHVERLVALPGQSCGSQCRTFFT